MGVGTLVAPVLNVPFFERRIRLFACGRDSDFKANQHRSAQRAYLRTHHSHVELAGIRRSGGNASHPWELKVRHFRPFGHVGVPVCGTHSARTNDSPSAIGHQRSGGSGNFVGMWQLWLLLPHESVAIDHALDKLGLQLCRQSTNKTCSATYLPTCLPASVVPGKANVTLSTLNNAIQSLTPSARPISQAY